jgi:hypothetical protein
MKKVLLPILLGLTIVSCKTTKHTDCDAYSLNKQFSNDTLTRSEKIIQSVNEDLRIVDTWTEEERAYFYEHFVFSYKELEEKVGLKLK